MRHPIRIGIGGWTYPPWRGAFYPDDLPHARELAFASRALTAIEVNGTFYRTQTPKTFAKWHDEVPDDFVFTLKAPRYVTARRDLTAGAEGIGRFLASGLTELGVKLGPINWQFPPTKTFDADEIARFLDMLPDRQDGHPVRHAIEARHDSFACTLFKDMLRDRKIAAVRGADGPFPEIDIATAPFAYLRIMGTTEGEPAGYKDNALTRWAKTARAIAKNREVFLFVISGHKPANPAAAQAIVQRLSPKRRRPTDDG